MLLCCVPATNCSLANARDVGEWLGASGHATFNFAPGVRPVPLEIHMHGLDIHNFEARMQVRVVGRAATPCLVRKELCLLLKLDRRFMALFTIVAHKGQQPAAPLLGRQRAGQV